MKRIIISGGNFINKGAEAMLFVAASECFGRFDKCVCSIQLPEGFCEVGSLNELYDLSIGKVKCQSRGSKSDKVKTMLRQYKSADIMLDISGYELSSKLGNYPSLRYIFKIALSKWTKTRVVLMPQSYGPFEYQGKFKRLIPVLIKRYMKYPLVCFAREKESAEALKEIAPKSRVKLSADLVLQNNTVLPAIQSFYNFSRFRIPDKSVGLVVNRRLYEQHGKEQIFLLYKTVVMSLLKKKKTVYLLCHASDDLDICSEIKAEYENNNRVIAFEKVLSCFEFQLMAKEFEYVIAARYHSIVHAYKEGTPCIALGWAVKYKELLELMGQQSYLVDISSSSVESLEDAIERIDKTNSAERKVISSRLEIIQKHNCFDEMEKAIGA